MSFIKGWSLTTCCFELHRLWRRRRVASAAKWELSLSRQMAALRALVITEAQRAIRDAGPALDASVRANLERQIERLATTSDQQLASRFTPKSVPSSRPIAVTVSEEPLWYPFDPACPASLLPVRQDLRALYGLRGS